MFVNLNEIHTTLLSINKTMTSKAEIPPKDKSKI